MTSNPSSVAIILRYKKLDKLKTTFFVCHVGQLMLRDPIILRAMGNHDNLRHRETRHLSEVYTSVTTILKSISFGAGACVVQITVAGEEVCGRE